MVMMISMVVVMMGPKRAISLPYSEQDQKKREDNKSRETTTEE
jgi:hypothetical protein